VKLITEFHVLSSRMSEVTPVLHIIQGGSNMTGTICV
jgi:hypothetical protein